MGRHISLEPTKEGAQLTLSSKQQDECKVVYIQTEEKGKYEFFSIWNSEMDEEYDEDYIILPLTSVYADTFTYTIYDTFANIIGSTYDPKHGVSSWIQLLRDKGIDCSRCITDGYFYDSRDSFGNTVFRECNCNTTIIGGHVIRGTLAQGVAQGSYIYVAYMQSP